VASVLLAALVWFDLGAPLAFADDFLYSWSVHQLAAGHGLRILPEQAPLALVQVLLAWLIGLGHADPRVLRLLAIPFILLAAGSVYRLGRRFGADRFWALVGALSLLAAPIFLSVATSFMTDIFFAGLLMAAALGGVLWVEEGRGTILCFSCVILAGIERQNGVALVGALAVGLLVARSRRTVQRREWVTLAALWVASALVLLLPSALGLATGTHRLAGLLTANPLRLLRATSFFPPLLGLLLAPLLLALAFAPRSTRTAGRWSLLGCLALAEVGVLNLGVQAVSPLVGRAGGNPGSYLNLSALGPGLLLGHKQQIYPLLLFVVIQAVALITFVVVLGYHRRDWCAAPIRSGTLFLLLVAGTQLLPLVQGDPFDRYYIPVIAPLIPLVATVASRTTRPRLAAGWAFLVLGAWLIMYVAGEQDYQAWQVARDAAARMAYQMVPPSRVDAGYEANATYWELPLYERTGKPVGKQPSDIYGEPSLLGPPNPSFRLEFASRDDPRPGVSYWSLAPGRIVIVPLP
jgi:hypothetical protein